jgi:outer membrane receptor protein involved in Fe transport
LTVSSNHIDPHIGLVYRTDDVTWLRLAFGSAVYGPGSTLVSGRSTYTPPAASNNNQGLITTVNPNLRPEVTFAYGLGMDHRLPDGSLSFTATGSPVTIGGATITPLVNQTINASLQRTYGVEVGLHRMRRIASNSSTSSAFRRASIG